MLTDFWIKPGSVLGKIPGGRRLKDRFHPGLSGAKVIAPNLRMLEFEIECRLGKKRGWEAIMARNRLFQREAIAKLSPITNGESGTARRSVPTLFSYSYAARDVFRFAKARGWQTVLGQIDPGPEEERIVAAEHERYPTLASSWQPAPAGYWESWREEIELADRVIVNSEWSRQCLIKDGVSPDKMEIVPLVYEETNRSVAGVSGTKHQARSTRHKEPSTSFRLLFLGQINLRKGIARLLEAMQLLKDEPVELILAGPSEIDPTAWADLPRVKWIGPVPRSGVGDVYRDANAFILPTLSDGFALTQLEALARRLPVIASKCCGDVVIDGRNGWLLEDLKPESIATVIRRAMLTKLDPREVRPPAFDSRDLANALMGDLIHPPPSTLCRPA